MKALVLAPFSDEALAQLRCLGEVVYRPWQESQELFDPEELGILLAAGNFDTLIIEADFVLEETLAAAPQMRFIGACRGNIGEHIDLATAERQGVLVVNTPGRNAIAVAEFTICLLLSLARRLPQANQLVHSGQWQGALDGYLGWQGLELAGKTIGLVGYGAVGQAVAKRLAAFAVRLLIYDPYVASSELLPSPGSKFTTLEDLLRRSDFVSLHAAVTPETVGMIAAPQLAMMKPSAYLVNTARSALIVENDLLVALRQQKIAGAALDVHDLEPLPPNSPWWQLDNVILTPHIAGATADVVRHQAEMLVADISRWQRGEKPVNLINPTVWERR